MLNIVVPMAGRGKRFADAGFAQPKPLIPVRGIPMTKVVIDNVRPQVEHRFIFLCLSEHLQRHDLDVQLRRWAPGCVVIQIDGVTEGAACTVLCARLQIATDDPLMIVNCDQWVDANFNHYLSEMDRRGADGLIMTMTANDPKWSYVRFDAEGSVCEVVEKRVVSNEATVGVYNFRRGNDFVTAADAMIASQLRVNGEFYVAPAYNQMITGRQRVVTYNVGRDQAGMYGLGIPEDLAAFERLPISDRVLAAGDSTWRE